MSINYDKVNEMTAHMQRANFLNEEIKEEYGITLLCCDRCNHPLVRKGKNQWIICWVCNENKLARKLPLYFK